MKQSRMPRMGATPPTIAGSTWQGGLFRFPSWIGPDGDMPPFRPWLAAWVCASSRFAFQPVIGKTPEKDPSLLVESYRSTISPRGRGVPRPRRLEVFDEETAAILRGALEGEDLEVEVADSLPDFEFFRDEMLREFRSREGIPSMLDRPGVTPERVELFADAAAAFHRSTPWDRLDDEDPILIECRHSEPGLRLAVVIGSGGESFGLVFMKSEDDYLSIMVEAEEADRGIYLEGQWGIQFVPPYEIPTVEHDLWEELRLPLASPDAYPLPIALGPETRILRPDARQLAYFEGILRALAESTDDELDSGRWERSVSTASGPMSFGFVLPNLLDPEGDLARLSWDEQGFLAEHPCLKGRVDIAPALHAQGLANAASDAYGRRQIKLAREALAIWPNCAEAYLALASRVRSGNQKRSLMVEALRAAERAVEEMGRGDGTVPVFTWYLRVHWLWAHFLYRAGEMDAAAAEFAKMIDADPEDRRGARSPLLLLLILRGRCAEARALLDRHSVAGFRDEAAARALLSFRDEGPTDASTDLLRVALEVAPDLTERVFPRFGGGLELGILLDLGSIWRAVPGASEWLKSHTRSRTRPKSASRTRKRR